MGTDWTKKLGSIEEIFCSKNFVKPVCSEVFELYIVYFLLELSTVC